MPGTVTFSRENPVHLSGINNIRRQKVRLLNKKVEGVLRFDLEARKNDRVLQLRVWEMEGFYLTDAQKDKFLHISSSESIRRTRQKFQEHGLFPADKATREARKELEIQTKQELLGDQVLTPPKALSWLSEED